MARKRLQGSHSEAHRKKRIPPHSDAIEKKSSRATPTKKENSPYEPPICEAGITTDELRKHLFARAAQHRGSSKILTHVKAGCLACAMRIEALTATEPFLQGIYAQPLGIQSKTVRRVTTPVLVDSEDQREKALQELVDALMRIILGRVDAPSEDEVNKLQEQFFSRPPGRLREGVAARCRTRHRQVPLLIQERAQGLWAMVVDDLASGSGPIVLTAPDKKTSAAFRLWALGERWMLATREMPWQEETADKDGVKLIVRRDVVASAVGSAQTLEQVE